MSPRVCVCVYVCVEEQGDISAWCVWMWVWVRNTCSRRDTATATNYNSYKTIYLVENASVLVPELLYHLQG